MPELPTSTPAPNLAFLGMAPSVAPSVAPFVPPPSSPPLDLPEPLFDANGMPVPLASNALAPPAALPEPPPGPPLPTAPMTGDIELTRLPRGGLEPVFDLARRAQVALRKVLVQARAGMAANGGLGRGQLRALGADGRPKWFLPVVALAGLIVGIGLFAFIGALIRGGGDNARASTGTPSSAP